MWRALKYRPDSQGVVGGCDVQKACKRPTKRFKGEEAKEQDIYLDQPQEEGNESGKDDDDSSSPCQGKVKKSPCRIALKLRVAVFQMDKIDLTHNHGMPSVRAQARDERYIKAEWARTIKSHGALSLTPTMCLELLETQYGDGFRDAKIEARDISYLDYNFGDKVATDCYELVEHFETKKKEDLRWVVEVEK